MHPVISSFFIFIISVYYEYHSVVLILYEWRMICERRKGEAPCDKLQAFAPIQA